MSLPTARPHFTDNPAAQRSYSNQTGSWDLAPRPPAPTPCSSAWLSSATSEHTVWGAAQKRVKIWHLKLNVQLVRPGRPCACGSVHPHQHGVSGFTAHARPLAMTRPLFCGHRVSDLLFLLPAACVIEVFVVSVLGSCFNM